MNLETKFGIGDTAYGLRTWEARKYTQCPLCSGTQRVAVVGSSDLATCPKCNYSGKIEVPGKSVRFSVQELTIGEVRAATNGQRQSNVYMAPQTGIGSGTLWAEEQLHTDEADALAAAYSAGASPDAREYS